MPSSINFPALRGLLFRPLICWLLLTAIAMPASGDDEPGFDMVIRRGHIVDGTGNPWFVGDLGIRGDRIVAIARQLAGRGKRELDAKGLVVAPGFIDIHSHSDQLLLEDGKAESKIRQGVTTEILGEGFSAAPFVGQLVQKTLELPDGTLRWSSFPEYFQLLESRGIAVNVASYVGLNNVWQSVLGQTFDRPTPAQIESMKQLVEQAMQDGALGLSSQVMMPPGSLATTEEIIQLCRVVARYGGIYSTHIRNEGQGVLASVREAIKIGKQANVPVDVIHLKIADQRMWGQMQQVVDLIQEARARGIDVQANVYPYTRGNNNLVSIIPPWAHEGGRAKLLERLRDAGSRERIKRDIQGEIPGWYNHFSAVGGDWSRILVSGNNRFQGLTMDRVMSLRTQGQHDPDLLDELFDLLLEEQGSVGAVYAHHTERDMNLALVQPWCSIGSDGSAYAIDGPLRRGHPHPRNFGTFPRVLGVYVRQQGLLRLEDAIRKMSSLNAAKVGLRQRGQLAEGFFADITLFDPETVLDQATYTDPFQYNVGIKYVLVNGQIVLENGQHTGQLPGRALKN